MQAYKTETTLTQNSTLTLTGLPFQAGESVEVIVSKKPATHPDNPYPLRGMPITYIDPVEPVAQGDWEAVK